MKSSKKRIAVVSFFRSTNIGDLILSAALADSFSEYEIKEIDFPTASVCREQEVCCASVAKNDTVKPGRVFLHNLKVVYGWCRGLATGALTRRIESAFEDVDAVVLCGGNMIMDLSAAPGYTLWCYLYSFVARKKGVPVYYFAVGVGPIKTRLQKNLAKASLKRARYIGVRDNQSYDICNALGIKNCCVCADAVFARSFPYGANKSQAIGLCVGSYACVEETMTYDEYKAFVTSVINEILLQNSDMQIVLFSTEINDYAVIRDLQISCDRLRIEEIHSLDDLLDLYKNLQCVISMRMHALIIGMLSGKATFGLAWQDKVISLYQMLGCEQNCLNVYDKHTKGSISARMNNFFGNMQDAVSKQEDFVVRQRMAYTEKLQELKQKMEE